MNKIHEITPHSEVTPHAGKSGNTVKSQICATLKNTTNLDEAVVEAEVVSDAVLPSLSVLLVVWELVHDKVIDLCQRQPAIQVI